MDSWILDQLSDLRLLGLVALAAGLGGAVGFEREVADKPAGLRTHMLVAAASALIVAVGTTAVIRFGGLEELVRADPIRLLEAVVTGVSFLGAGTILRSRERGAIEGLTTAASLLVTAAIGVTVALERLLLALGVTVLALVTLRLVRRLERRFQSDAESDSGSGAATATEDSASA